MRQLKQRSSSVGRGVVILVIGFLLFVFLGCLGKSKESTPLTKFKIRWNEMILVVTERLGEDRTFRGNEGFFREMEDLCERQSNFSDEPESVLFKALAEYYQEGGVAAKQCVDCFDELNANGGFDFEALLSDPKKSTIERHSKLVKSSKLAVDDMIKFEDQAAQKFRDHLARSNVEPELIDRCVDFVKVNTLGPEREKDREEDARLMELYDLAIDLVLREWDVFGDSIEAYGARPFEFSSHVVGDEWDEIMTEMSHLLPNSN